MLSTTDAHINISDLGLTINMQEGSVWGHVLCVFFSGSLFYFIDIIYENLSHKMIHFLIDGFIIVRQLPTAMD